MANEGDGRSGASARRFSFGSVAFDQRSLKLYAGGRAVELELKPLEVLRYLLEHAGEAVSKDDLVKAVWPGRVISDSALTSTIAKLREALGEEGEAIKTVHGFGYRLEAEVRVVEGSGKPEPESEPSTQPSRRLAAIMFTDLVGYSALAHRDERLALELLELHRSWVREILPRHGGREIETIGDAFLIEFAGALAAVECAVAIQQRFAEHNRTAPEARRMELRIGIHLGDVEHRGDKVMGDGVNIASRIHGLAEPGHICVSEGVYHAVRNRIATPFSSLGSPALKNISTAFEIFTTAAAGQPQAAEAQARETVFRRRYAVPLAAAVALLALGVGIWKGTGDRAPAGPSVAVLPFENLSSEADSAYFTDGLHDTVIGHLARIRDLKVISRTSVMAYRGKQTSLRQIASELGVAHILEGSVQRAGTRLRVVAQLIDATTDAHLWSNEYDRELADVFAVQADIARQVAAAVHAQLTPREAAAIARVPTTSQEAYDLYLRALAISRKADQNAANVSEAVGLLERAVALDPDFALAHAALAQAHDIMYWFGYDPTQERREKVRREVETLERLAPGTAEAHFTRAVYLYHGPRRYEEALKELEIARGLAPGNGWMLSILGAIYRRQDRWDDAVATFEKATSLDPLNHSMAWEHAWTLELLRRYDEADRIYARIASLEPDKGFIAAQRAGLHFARTGDIEPTAKVLEGVPPGFDPGCGPSLARWTVNWVRRKFREAAAAILACKEPYFMLDAMERAPKELFAALAFEQAGDREQARRHAEMARAQLIKHLGADPDLALTRSGLARMLLVLGDTEGARAEMERALKDMPLSRDAIVYAGVLGFAAMLHARLGETERALDELEEALVRPGGLHAHGARLDPHFDSLRDDPRFRKLIADRLPKGST